MAIGYTWDVSTVDTYPTKDSKSDVVYRSPRHSFSSMDNRY